MLRSAWLVFLKDVRMEFRGKEALNAAVAFALVVLVLLASPLTLPASNFTR